MSNNYPVDVTGGINININNNDGLRIEDTDPIYLNVKGDIMHGNLNMNNHFIKNVGDPKEDNDVVTKKYLDSKVAATNKDQHKKENIFTSQYKIFKFPKDIEEYKKFITQKNILILEEFLQTKYVNHFTIRIDEFKRQSQPYSNILKNDPTFYVLKYTEEKKRNPNGVFTLEFFDQTGKLIVTYIENEEIEKPGYYDQKQKK